MSTPSDQALVPGPGWGSAHGLIDLKPAVPVPATSALDRILILERLYRYSWALDECLQQPLEECFTENASWAANLMGNEEVGPFTGGREIAAWLATSFVTMQDQRHHLLINPVVDQQGENEASAYTMVLITGAMDKKVTPRCTGFYRFTLKKANDVWLIDSLFGGFDTPW